MDKLIAREKEQAILREALTSDSSEMVAIMGRRRVGKNYYLWIKRKRV